MVPTLVVWNQDDHCAASSPAGSAALFGAIPASTKASDVLNGGHSVATDPCGAFSEHGYAGTAREAVKDIAQFIRQTH
jgi:pimeloyl-ACP methyl ester carboxylesterase